MVEIPFRLGDVPEQSERDGCDCPDYVDRCSHLPDGRRLWLISGVSQRRVVDKRLGKKERCVCGARRRIGPVDTGASICWGYMEEPICPCRIGMNVEDRSCYQSFSNDFDAALAAFHEAEERLLRGEL